MPVNDFKEIDIGDKHKFNVDNPDVLKRLAVDVYESRLSGYRELITNATSAIRESVDEGYIKENEGVINVEIDTRENKMIIEDNGRGISKERLNTVVTNIGASTSRDDIDTTGQYGMGFLSAFKLTGFDGGFKMITKSRDTDESYEGFWTNEGFNLYEENIDVSYGTRFEINLDFNIELREYYSGMNTSGIDFDKLKKITKYPRVNTSLDIDSPELNFNEDWCNIEDVIGTDEYIHIDNDFFELILTDRDGYGDVVCLDSYISTRGIDIPDMGNYSLLRLKQEESVIVEGKDKGDVINNPDNTDGRIWTPKPTGTRDVLRDTTDDFNEWLYNKVKYHIEKNILQSDDTEIAYLGCKYMIYNGVTPNSVVDNTELQEKILKENDNLEILEKYDIEEDEFVESENPTVNGDIYMCKSPTDRKIYSILKKDNTPVKYTGNKNARQIYQRYGGLFNWNKVTDHNMSDDVKIVRLSTGNRYDSGFKISLEHFINKDIDKKIVYNYSNKSLHINDDDILTTKDERLLELENCVHIEDFAQDYISGDIMRYDKVYKGTEKALNIINQEDNSICIKDMNDDKKQIIKCLDGVKIESLDSNDIFNRMVDDVNDDEVRSILESIKIRRLDMDEVIKLGNSLRNNI